ncbi:MAG: PEP-CTERM sorting domain-containing protein [Armatimonadota bacterium]
MRILGLLAACLILTACVGPALANDVGRTIASSGLTVPEPGSLLALSTGLIGLVGFVFRKRGKF